MSFIEDTLKRLGVDSYEDMTEAEKATYDSWLTQMSKDITVNDIRDNIRGMQNSVILELSEEPEFIYSKIFPFLKIQNPKNVYLKARLKNYLMLSAFLSSPEEARKTIERNLQQLK